MSYILDALKEAEREREQGKAPTLATTHPLPPGSRRQAAVWMLIGGLMAGSALSFWLIRPARQVVAPAALEAKAPATAPVQAEPSAAVQSPATQDARDIPRSSVAAPGAPDRPARDQWERAERLRRPAADPTRETSGSFPPLARPTHAPDDVTRVQDVRLPENLSILRSSPPSPPTTAARIEPTPGAATPPALPPPLQPEQRSPSDPVRTPAASALPPSPPPASPGNLREAMAKMVLNVVVYSDVEAERIVYIGNRQYREGQHVDGLYLVAQITPEGVVLSYKGERDLLQSRPSPHPRP